MVLDRDYPWTRREAQFTAVGLAIMAVVGILLFGGFLPGIHPTFTPPSTVTVHGQQYYLGSTSLRAPLLVNYTAPWNVTFHNVTFRLWLSNWYGAGGGLVHGNGTEPNGTAFSFLLGNLSSNGSRTVLYVSPDAYFGAYWPGGLFGGTALDLLVRV